MYDQIPLVMLFIPKLLWFRTIQTAVLIETLTALGAEVTWSSCVGSLCISWMFAPDALFRTSFPPRIMPLLRERKPDRCLLSRVTKFL